MTMQMLRSPVRKDAVLHSERKTCGIPLAFEATSQSSKSMRMYNFGSRFNLTCGQAWQDGAAESML